MTRSRGDTHNAGVVTFKDDDGGYLDWLAGQRLPDSYVLNTERSPRQAYLILHRATCHTINGEPARGTKWTHDFIKVCGGRAELESFAREVGGTAQPCSHCQ